MIEKNKKLATINRNMSGVQRPAIISRLNYNPVYFAGFFSMYLTTVLGLVFVEIQAINKFSNCPV
jgi:hypothetical protein